MLEGSRTFLSGRGRSCCDLVSIYCFGGGFGKTYTSACGKRTLAPYTMPFRTPFTSVRMSWYFGSRTIFSSADHKLLVCACCNLLCASIPRALVTCPCLVLRDELSCASVRANDAQLPFQKVTLRKSNNVRIERSEKQRNGRSVECGSLDRVASWSETAGYRSGCG